MTEMKIDPAEIARYRELDQMRRRIDEELDAIKARWRVHGVGKYGDVTISENRRFSVTMCKQWVETNAPQLLPAITEEVISSSKAKQLLPPAVYDSMMAPIGDPRVSVRA